MTYEQKKLIARLVLISSLVLILALPSVAGIHTRWQSLNGPFGATVVALHYDLQLGLFSGNDCGIYHFEPSDSAWLQLSTDGRVTAIAVSSSHKIYVQVGSRIMESSDAGYTWGMLTDQSESISSGLHVYGDSLIIGDGILSRDGGVTWERIWVGPSCFDSRSQNLYVGNGRNCYQSKDSGRTWIRLDSSFASICAITTDRMGTIFVGDVLGGIFRSTDLGVTWDTVGVQKVIGRHIINVLIALDSLLVAASSDIPSVLWSTNKGDSWQISAVSSSAGSQGIFSIARDTLGNWYAGTFCGVYTTRGLSQPWRPMNTNMSCFYRAHGLLVDSLGYIFAGTPGGLSRSTDGGQNWSNKPIAATAFITSPTGDSIFTNGNRLYMSPDHGSSWQPFGVDSMVPLNFTYTNRGVFVAGTRYGAFFSTDGGAYWQSNPDSNYFPGKVWWLATNPFGDIFMVDEWGVDRSNDNGKTWQGIWGSRANYGLALMATENNTLFMSFIRTGIARSTNNGVSWQEVNNGMPYLGSSFYYPVHELFSVDNIVFAMTEKGTVVTTDQGDHWSLFDPVDTVETWSMAVDRQGYLYKLCRKGVFKSIEPVSALTGVQERSAVSTHYQLSQNYPNPFNPTTDIGYRIADLGFVSLKIYNTLGQQVATLVNEVKPPGSYSVTWNAGNNPSGVYFYKLSAMPTSGGQAGTYVEVKKMLLIQ